MREGKAGPQEGFCAATLCILAVLLIVKPAGIGKIGNTFYYTILISAAGAFAVFAVCALAVKISKKDGLVEAALSGGRFFAVLTGVCAAFSALWLAVQTAASYAEVFDNIMFITMENGSAKLLLGIFVCVLFMALRGWETIVRISKLYLIVFVILIVMLCASLAEWIDVSKLFPLMGGGVGAMLTDGLRGTRLFSGVTLVMVTAGALHGEKLAFKAGGAALAVSALIAAGVYLFICMMFSYTLLNEAVSPIYSCMDMTVMGDYYQRMDEVFMFMWLLCAFPALAFLLYGAANAWSKAFAADDIRPALAAMCSAACVLSISLCGSHSLGVLLNSFFEKYGWLLPALGALSALIAAAAGRLKNA